MNYDPQSEEEVCYTCTWFAWHPSKKHGYCKYYPPHMQGKNDNGFEKYGNPTTPPTSWCSFWEGG